LPDKRKYRNALRKLRLLAELSEHAWTAICRAIAPVAEPKMRQAMRLPYNFWNRPFEPGFH
jgi:hypothetical protein